MNKYVRIVAMLLVARENGIKYPKLRLKTERGLHLKLSMTRAGRHPGSVSVVDYQRDGFLGRIDANATAPADRFSEDITEALVAMNADPAGYATLYGQRTGHCCFCGRTLTHKNSIALGYGPICAEKWCVFHDYSKGAVDGSEDHDKPSEIVEAASAVERGTVTGNVMVVDETHIIDSEVMKALTKKTENARRMLENLYAV